MIIFEDGVAMENADRFICENCRARASEYEDAGACTWCGCKEFLLEGSDRDDFMDSVSPKAVVSEISAEGEA